MKKAILTIQVSIQMGVPFFQSFPELRKLSNRLKCNVQAQIGVGIFVITYYGGEMLEWSENNPDYRIVHNN